MFGNGFRVLNLFFFFYVVALLVAAYRINANEAHPEVDYLRCDTGVDPHAEWDPVTYQEQDIVDDQVWISSRIGGKLMGLAHVIMIMMGSVQAEQAFYTVPHHIGYYNTADACVIEDRVMSFRKKKGIMGTPGGILTDLKGLMVPVKKSE